MPTQPPSKATKIVLIAAAVFAALIVITIIVSFIGIGYLGVSSSSPVRQGVNTLSAGQTPSAGYSRVTGEKNITGGAASDSISETESSIQNIDRKVIKDGSLSLLVKSADQTARDMKGIAQRLGGFVSSADIYEITAGTKTGSVTIRVPSDRFDQAMEDAKKLAIKVEHENVSAQDVTEQYVDLESRLKNLQAQETQYLQILKQAVKIPDILQVTAQLDQVRMQIEQIQGQLKYLSRQVDMASISASLTEETDVQVFGLRWRPLVVVKQAFSDMLSSLQVYVDSLIKIVFALPSILLWLATIGLIIFIGWKILHWFWKRFLSSKIV
jgi:hypothetical protein